MHDDSIESCCTEMMDRMSAEGTRQQTCLMSKMCNGIGKVNPGFFLAVLGAALVLCGAAIALAPTLLVWFVAGASILLGIGILVVAGLASRFSTRLRSE